VCLQIQSGQTHLAARVELVEVVLEVQEEVVLEVPEEVMLEVQEEIHCKIHNHCKSSTCTLMTMEKALLRTNLCTLRKMSSPCNVATYTLMAMERALLHTMIRIFLC